MQGSLRVNVRHIARTGSVLQRRLTKVWFSFYQEHLCCRLSYLPRLLYSVAPHDESGPVLFSLLWAYSALEFSVRDVFEPVLWDLLLPNEVTRVGGGFDPIPYPLEEAAKLIRRRCAPGCADVCILMVDELSVF